MNERPLAVPETGAIESPRAALTTVRNTRFLISSAVFFALALAAVILIPRFEAQRFGGTQPGFITFFGVGLAMILLTGGLVLFGLRSGYRKMPLVLIYTFAYNALIVVVKFSLAPASLYAANLEQPIELQLETFGLATPQFWLAAAAVAIFGLYAAAFWALHGLVRSRQLSGSARWLAWAMPLVLTTAIIGAGGLFLVFLGPLDYIYLVFSTPAAIFIALALGGAVGLAAAALGTVSRQTRLVRDATLMAGFLWVGLAFIALYHALWFVYMLVLISIWPLRTYVPK